MYKNDKDAKSQLVSVIMPVHNRFKLVRQAINSVINQTYRPIELIIVDDFSNIPFDPLVEELENLNGINIVTIRNIQNLGPGLSREVGRGKINGTYVCYMDSDDLCHPDRFQKQVSYMEEHFWCGMSYCQTEEISEDLNHESSRLRAKNDHGTNNILPEIFTGRPWSTGACLWTRKVTESIGPWFKSWTWEDFAYDCLAGCLDVQVGFIPEVLYYKRQTNDPDRLSNRDVVNAEVHKALSIQNMSDNLIKYNKLNDANARLQYMYYVLKPNVKKLIRYKEYELAKYNFSIFTQLVESPWKNFFCKLLNRLLRINRYRVLSLMWRAIFKYV